MARWLKPVHRKYIASRRGCNAAWRVRVGSIGVTAIGMCGATIGVFAQGDMPAMPPARVEIATAELREMAPVVEVPGTVVSLNDSRIAAEVEGVLTWLANIGDAVDAGAQIARIDPRLLQIAVKRARANVARLEADHRFREQQFARATELAASNIAAVNFLDEAQAQRDQSLHRLDDAHAHLERVEGDLERSTIRAPFAGHVTARLAAVGEYVSIGSDVIRLVDTHRIEVALPAAIGLIDYIRSGLEVTVKNDRIVRQHPVRAVVPVGDAKSRMVEIRLSAGDGDWLVGTPVQVSLPSDLPVKTVAVPRDALVERNGQSFVFRINADGTAERISIKIQSMVGLWAGITDGIAPGDRVIIRGAERLAPGQAVEIITAGDMQQ